MIYESAQKRSEKSKVKSQKFFDIPHPDPLPQGEGTMKQYSNITIRSGFTLIELLIVISIIGLLTTLTIAAYRTFDKSQKFNNARNDVINALQVARSRASSQYAPASECDQEKPDLESYAVVISGQLLETKVTCRPPSGADGDTNTETISTTTIADSVSVTALTVTFNVQGTTTFTNPAATSATITVADPPQSKQIVVFSNGRVDALD